MEDEDELNALATDERSMEIEANYPGCRVFPLSKLTVNETGVENGDINFFDIQMYVSSRGARLESSLIEQARCSPRRRVCV